MLNLPTFIRDSATVIFQECDYEGVRGGGVGEEEEEEDNSLYLVALHVSPFSPLCSTQ